MLTNAATIAEWCGGQRQGDNPILSGVCIDSRCVRHGDLFVALPGSRVDGHDFVTAAAKNGAAAALVGRQIIMSSQIIVGNCEMALAQIAAHWRAQFVGQIAAITGSNGKTTVKEMLTLICRAAVGHDCVFGSRGNMNNRLGMSLNILELRPQHQLAVLEAGMDASGELRELGAMCRPQVVTINNAQRAHLEQLHSVDAIARAKGELIESLSANGTAVFCADAPHAPLWQQLAADKKILTFGFNNNADYRGTWREHALYLPDINHPIKLQVGGAHNVHNAVAAAATATALNLSATAIVRGLQQFGGVAGRMQYKQTAAGAVLIDDSYNANPDSLAAALSVLAQCDGEKFAVLGDMLALGAATTTEHIAAGKAAIAIGAQLLTIGEQMQAAAGQHFADKESLIKYLRPRLSKDATVLIKGSRGMRMETIVQALEQPA